MPTFQYTARTRDGQAVSGALDAPGATEAARTLRGRTLFVTSLVERGVAGHDGGAAAGKDITPYLKLGLGVLLPVTVRDHVVFFRQMAVMLRAGLTLTQALAVAEEQGGKLAHVRSLEALRASIEAGRSCSEAMAAQGRRFPLMAVKLIESAEASGEMDATMERIADYLEQRANLRVSLLTSLTYPAIVVLVSGGVFGFLTWKVIPKFAVFFARRNQVLPPATQALMNLSSWLQRHGLWLLCAAGVLAAVIAVAHQTPGGKLWLHRALLRVPLVGTLLTVGAMAQLGRTLGMLQQSGVTLLESLRIAAGTVGNRAVGRVVERAGERVLAGQSFATGLQDSVVPPLMRQMVAVGERTGALAETLRQAGEFYERDLQSRIKRMSALVEPVTTLLIGGMVGFVYYAFFQAIFQVAAGR